MADTSASRFQRVMSRMRWPGRVLSILFSSALLGTLVGAIMVSTPSDSEGAAVAWLYVAVWVVPAVVLGALGSGFGKAAGVRLPLRTAPRLATWITVVGYAIMTVSPVVSILRLRGGFDGDFDALGFAIFALGAIVLLGGVAHLLVSLKRGDGWSALILWNLIGLVYPFGLWAVLESVI